MSGQQNPAPAGTPARLKPMFYATKPTRVTRFFRIFLPWQMWRFVAINLRMFGLIARSHRTHPQSGSPHDRIRTARAG